ncbi:hypothetical protein MYX64_07500 [Nitrospinae bacterium AH_259_B05_G02_I21]|nr:hypothetical protein [Nitrospinae bacterium AH_259_B05_G02_I21]MDA2932436.1 hypothetical protein [Nitrospinae bacterium AH-259-F20]
MSDSSSHSVACPLCGHLPDEELLPLRELARRSGYSQKRLREFCKQKVNPLPYDQLGQGKILVSWSAFRRWLNGSTASASLSREDRDILRELDAIVQGVG